MTQELRRSQIHRTCNNYHLISTLFPRENLIEYHIGFVFVVYRATKDNFSPIDFEEILAKHHYRNCREQHLVFVLQKSEKRKLPSDCLPGILRIEMITQSLGLEQEIITLRYLLSNVNTVPSRSLSVHVLVILTSVLTCLTKNIPILLLSTSLQS